MRLLLIPILHIRKQLVSGGPKVEHITILGSFQKVSKKVVTQGQLLHSFVVSRKSTPIKDGSLDTEKQRMELFLSVSEREIIPHVFLDSNSQKISEERYMRKRRHPCLLLHVSSMEDSFIPSLQAGERSKEWKKTGQPSQQSHFGHHQFGGDSSSSLNVTSSLIASGITPRMTCLWKGSSPEGGGQSQGILWRQSQ